MKLIKTILIVSVLLVNYANAKIDPNELIRKYCQYEVYGNGNDDIYSSLLMLGIVQGYMFGLTPKDRINQGASPQNVLVLACKEALNNNSTQQFSDKYKIGVAVTIDKKYAKYSNLKK